MPGIDPNSMDVKLADIKTNATELHLCSVAPATLVPGGAISGSLGHCTLNPGDWTLGNGSGAGDRLLTLAAKQINSDPAGGQLLSIVAYDATNSRIKAFWDAFANPAKTIVGSQTYTVPELTIGDIAPVNVQ